jgi:cytidylate kinase
VQRVVESNSIDEQAAERRVRDNDRARAEYGRRLYGVHPDDDDLFHIVIDTSAFDLTTCVDLIIAASDARVRNALERPGD